MKNIFTIDTEDWFHANYEGVHFSEERNMVSTVEANVDRYLELFELYHVKATFFVLGTVAERHSGMVKKIAGQGHEIASHGYEHRLVYGQTGKQFQEDVHKSKVLLEDLIGKEVVGYRAPSWSITEKSLWALDILEEQGFRYTSSIFPTKNYLYGIPYAPRFVHGCRVYGKNNLKLLNIPPSTKKIANSEFRIPFSGGAYFRILPKTLIEKYTDEVNRKEKQPVVFYLHPREIDPQQPKLKLGLRDHLIHYYGIRDCEKKLASILKRYDFETVLSMWQKRMNQLT